MADPLTIALIIGAGAATAGAVQSRKARKEQKRQNKIQNRISANRRVRNIKKSIAQSRVARAQAEAAGFQFGVSGGSAVSGATAGIGSDLGSAIGASNQQFTAQQVIADSNDRIASLTSSAATFGSIASIAGMFGAGPVGAQNRSAVASIFGD